MEKNYKMVAKTFFGFEDILADELRNLGAMHVTKGVRSVQFEGDKGFMYKANLCLRTALKILKPIHFFYIRNEKEYYQKLYDFNWQEILDLNQTFAVTASARAKSAAELKTFACAFLRAVKFIYAPSRVLPRSNLTYFLYPTQICAALIFTNLQKLWRKFRCEIRASFRS